MRDRAIEREIMKGGERGVWKERERKRVWRGKRAERERERGERKERERERGK